LSSYEKAKLEKIVLICRVWRRVLYTSEMKMMLVVYLVVLNFSFGCGSSAKEEPAEDEFEGGQSSTVVTGANLNSVSTDCAYTEEEGTSSQYVNCKLLLSSATDAEESFLSIVEDRLDAVTAVDGIDIAWGVPPDLGFYCFSIRQATELFCFRESEDDLQDFEILLTVTSVDDRAVTIRIVTTAVSTALDQSALPEVPSGLQAVSASSTQIDLSYTDNSDNETRFAVERSLDQSSWSQIAVVASQVVAYSNTGLSASTLYYYRIKACNALGCSEPSELASATTDATGSSDQRIFISSGSWNGALGGTGGADSLCVSAASGAGLTGNWKAVVSGFSDNVTDRISINGIVRNLNGDIVANNQADFFDSDIQNPVGYNELAVSLNASAWTGSEYDGSRELNCQGWGSASPADESNIGNSGSTSISWLNAFLPSNCSELNHLYCIDGQ
jgi:hypothetical protein